MAFMDQAGNVTPARLDSDGSLPVRPRDDGDDSLPRLLLRVIAELREMRRMTCQAAGKIFTELTDQV